MDETATGTDRPRYPLLRVLLGSAGASHLALGIAVLIGKPGIDLGARVYGVNKQLDAQVYYVIGLAGAYMLSTGGLMSLAACDPHRYRHVIDLSLLLYGLNTIFRLRHMQDAERLFGVTPARLWVRIGFLDTVGALILLERLRLACEAKK